METRVEPISFHCEYTLRRKEKSYSGSLTPYSFTQSHPSGRTVDLLLSYSTGSVIARMDGIDVSSGVISELITLGRFDGEKLSESARAAIDPPMGEIRNSARNLLALVKYHLRHFDLHEGFFSVKTQQWCCASGDMRELPMEVSFSHEDFSNRPLDDCTHQAVQAALETRVLPLVAMRHLHRAKLESEPHHKWIDATTSAELAVKEVLCRAHPKMALMLMEMPSPPFRKMYGPLLKYYLGEESPYRKQLISGQEKRNTLVHQPGTMVINKQEANDYVAVVERAIFHLLALLYPNDRLIRQANEIVRH